MEVVIHRRAWNAIAMFIILCSVELLHVAEAQEQLQRTTEPIEVLDVCDALQQVDRLNGSDIAVRGYYRFGFELAGLYGRDCPKPLMLDGAQRAQAFYFEDGPNTVDHGELRSAADKLIQEQNSRAAIQVTMIGRIRARRADLIDLDGRGARMFGHLGVYPAEIVLREIREVSAIDAPEFPSNMSPNKRF